MRDRLTRAAMHFAVRYFSLILIIAAIASALAYPRAAALFRNIDTDLASLLPEDFDSVKAIEEVRAKFHSPISLIVIVEDPAPEQGRTFADALASHLEKDPTVSEVESRKRGFSFFDKHKLLFIDLDDLRTIRERIDRRIQKEKLGGLYIDFEDGGSSKDDEFQFGDLDQKYKSRYSAGVRSEYYTNDAKTIYALYVHPEQTDGGMAELKIFYDEMRGKIDAFAREHAKTTTRIFYTGSVRTRVDEYRTLIGDLALAGMISGAGILLVLLLYFRRAFAAALIFLPLAAGILMSFCVASFTVGNLNLITSFLFAILGGLGVEVGIHLLARYIEERRGSGAPRGDSRAIEEALVTVMRHTGVSAMTSSATVAATFFVLVINDFKGFSEFGLIAGIGLVINFLCYVLVFPALVTLAEKVRLLTFGRGIGFDRPRFLKGPSPAAAGTPQRFPLPRFVLGGLGILLLLTLLDMPRVDFEWRFSQIKAIIPEAQEAKAKHREVNKTVNSPAVAVVHSREEAAALKGALKQRMEALGDASVIDAVRSYYDLFSDQEEKMAVIGQMRDLLADKTLKLVKGEHKKDLDRFKEELAKAQPVQEEEIPPKVRELFKGTSGDASSELVYINPLPNMELDDGRNAIAFAEQIQRVETPAKTMHPTSDAIVFADVLRTMIADGKRVVVLAFLIVFGIVYLDFRRVRDALLVVSPIALGILYLFLIMYLFDLRLNFYNIIVIPTAVGTSIDNSVHLYHRLRELGRGGLIPAMKSSGSAALTSSLTNIFGFLGLCFTSHNGLRSIGDLAVAGLCACLLTTLVYFPALLQLLEDRKARS